MDDELTARAAPFTNAPEWLSLSQYAHAIGVHPRTARRWARDGHLPTTQVGPAGGTRRVHRSELDKLLNPPDLSAAA